MWKEDIALAVTEEWWLCSLSISLGAVNMHPYYSLREVLLLLLIVQLVRHTI